MRKFRIELHGVAEIEVEDSVIDAVDDGFRAALYNLRTPEEIAAHIGYNLIVNGIRLNQMDGWADQPQENARARQPEWDVTATEIK